MYIGKSPQTGAYSILDSLTASATASYTMQLNSVNYIPESAQHLIVSLNGSIQKPNSSFTVSGSTLTFSQALTSSDSIDFIYALGNVLDIGVPSDSTISTAKIIDSAVTNAKLANSSITLNGSSVSLGGSVTGIGEITPAFAVRKTDGNQSYSQNTWTKVTFNTELLDTDNAFASNKFTVPTGKAGTYLFNVMAQMGTIGTGSAYHIKLYVNGSDYSSVVQHATSVAETPIYGGVQAIDLSVGDYVEVFGITNGGAGNFTNNLCQFTGFKLGA